MKERAALWRRFLSFVFGQRRVNQPARSRQELRLRLRWRNRPASSAGSSAWTRTKIQIKHSDDFVVLDCWRRIVKVMKKFLPLLVFFRASEAERVILQRLPIHEQYISIPFFQASLKLVRDITVHRRNNCRCLFEGSLERRLPTSPHIEYCDLKNHRISPIDRM